MKTYINYIAIFSISISFFAACGDHATYNDDHLTIDVHHLLDAQYSPNGDKIAVLDEIGTIFILDAKTKQILSPYTLVNFTQKDQPDRGHEVLHFSEDGQMLYTCYSDPSYGIIFSSWDLNHLSNKTPLFRKIDWGTCRSYVTGDRFYHRGSHYVYDAKTGTALFRSAAALTVDNAGYLRTPYLMFDTSYDITPLTHNYRFESVPLLVYNTDTQEKVLETMDYFSVVVSPSKKQLLLRSRSQPVKELALWDVEQHKVVQTFSVPRDGFGEVVSLTFSQDGSRIAATSYTSQPEFAWFVWDVASGALIQSQTIPSSQDDHFDSFFDVQFVPHSNNRIMTHPKQPFDADHLWDVNSGNILMTPEFQTPALDMYTAGSGLDMIRFSPDGKQLFGSTFLVPGELLIWNLQGI